MLLAKLIPIALVIGLMAKSSGALKDQMDYAMNFTRVGATQHELRLFKKFIVLEMIETGQPPAESEWRKIVVDNIEPSGRDPLVDMWGYYYMYWASDVDFQLSSAGPDPNDASDDIVVRYNE